mgnify:CR=1 FL=1
MKGFNWVIVSDVADLDKFSEELELGVCFDLIDRFKDLGIDKNGSDLQLGAMYRCVSRSTFIKGEALQEHDINVTYFTILEPGEHLTLSSYNAAIQNYSNHMRVNGVPEYTSFLANRVISLAGGVVNVLRERHKVKEPEVMSGDDVALTFPYVVKYDSEIDRPKRYAKREEVIINGIKYFMYTL